MSYIQHIYIYIYIYIFIIEYSYIHILLYILYIYSYIYIIIENWPNLKIFFTKVHKIWKYVRPVFQHYAWNCLCTVVRSGIKLLKQGCWKKKLYVFDEKEKNGGRSLFNCSIANRNLFGSRSLKHSLRTARDNRVRKIRIRVAKSDRRIADELQPTNCFSVFDHFVGLALKRLNSLNIRSEILETILYLI